MNPYDYITNNLFRNNAPIDPTGLIIHDGTPHPDKSQLEPITTFTPSVSQSTQPYGSRFNHPIGPLRPNSLHSSTSHPNSDPVHAA